MYKLINHKEFILFILFSGTGLCIDLFIFFFFDFLGFNIFITNILSSFSAIIFVYISSTRLIYNQKIFVFAKLIKFFIFYSFSILLFTVIIWILTVSLNILPLIAKIISVPFSLLFNYFFSKRILTK